MATANIKIAGATYESVPSVTLKDANNADVNFVLTSDATMTADDLVVGVSGYGPNGMVFGELEVKTVYVGAGEPSSSLGVNGDIYLRTN